MKPSAQEPWADLRSPLVLARPQEITGKRTRQAVDGSKTIKVYGLLFLSVSLSLSLSMIGS